MRANNLSICIPNNGCNKNCPYCISKMTDKVNTDSDLFKHNMNKVKHFATMCGVTSISITGKGEPTMNMPKVFQVLRKFKDFPTELQTNGLNIERNADFRRKGIKKLIGAHLNVLAISIDKFEDIAKFGRLLCNETSLVKRITICVTDAFKDICLTGILVECLIYDIDQVSFRQITTPTYRTSSQESDNAVAWIKCHTSLDVYGEYMRELLSGYRIIRSLPYGATIYDYCGMSVVGFDYCIQDESNNDDIRSLIYKEDGHLYTTWDTKASMIF